MLDSATTHLFPHLPQALQTMEQVAAPQQLPAKDKSYSSQLVYTRLGVGRKQEQLTYSPHAGYCQERQREKGTHSGALFR